MARVAQNSGCTDTLGRVEYIFYRIPKFVLRSEGWEQMLYVYVGLIQRELCGLRYNRKFVLTESSRSVTIVTNPERVFLNYQKHTP